MKNSMTWRVLLAFGLSQLINLAVAEPAPQVSADAGAKSKQHCVTEISPVAAGAKSSATVDRGCYETFPAAIEAASKGAVRLSETVTPENITEADVGASAVFLIGIDYDGFNFSGASKTWITTNPNGCFFGNFYFANEPAFFSNRLSSTRAFSGCTRNKSFDGFNQTGAWVLCFPNCTLQFSPGSLLNNRTSSKLWWRP